MATREAELKRLSIRPLRSLDDYYATVHLQKRIWGFEDADRVAPRLFGVFNHIGGACLGAYLDEVMVGYTLAFAAFKADHRAYWHSHMAGVDPSKQGLGIGYQLKLRQREEALARGLDLIEWTFDPLQSRNAYFNIEKLGATVEAYLPNLYGVTSSELHGALPTDRLVAAWHLDQPSVTRRLAGTQPAPVRGQAAIAIPSRISDVPREEAAKIQALVRERFQAAFDANLRVTSFERTSDGGVYHLDE